MFRSIKSLLSTALGASLVTLSSISLAGMTVHVEGDVTTAVSDGKGKGLTASDYANAKHMPLPQTFIAPATTNPASYSGSPGFSPGSAGTGKVRYTKVPPVPDSLADEIAPQEYGTQNHPFSTSRVDTTPNRHSNKPPYRSTGKLFFKDGGSTFVCSASLIKPGVIVTAAHCVSDFAGNFYTDFEYHAARWGNKALGGIQGWASATVLTSYLNGTDSCTVPGIVCQNDVAVIRLTPWSGSTYIGHALGWYAYGWDGWGFTTTTPFAAGLDATHVTQLGYPVSHDSGNYMQRTDSLGYTDASQSNNTIIGTRQTGGSSGGPWLNNFGEIASLGGTGVGTYATSNTVIGVTSWGYVSTALKQQGASPFTSGNIVVLVNAVCPLGTEAWCI